MKDQKTTIFIALMDVDVEPENAEHKLLVLDKVFITI